MNMRQARPLLILILGAIGTYGLVPLVAVDIYRLLGLELEPRGIPGFVRVEPDMTALYFHLAITIICGAGILWLLRSGKEHISKVWFLMIALLLIGEATFILDQIALSRRRALEQPRAMQLTQPPLFHQFTVATRSSVRRDSSTDASVN
jgi:hypothetical protein